MPSMEKHIRQGSWPFISHSKKDKLITWSDRALSYALVADVQVGQLCVCVMDRTRPAEIRESFRLGMPSY